MLRRSLVSLSLILLSACSAQLPLQPRGSMVQAAADLRNTNNALNLIEEMAHAPADQFARIEAAFVGEIAKSSRPSLNKIMGQAATAIQHHPLPGVEPLDHPVARLILAAMERYMVLATRNLFPRAMEVVGISEAEPAQQEALIQTFARHVAAMPKQDAQELLKMLNNGNLGEVLPIGSPLHGRIVKIVQDRLAA